MSILCLEDDSVRNDPPAVFRAFTLAPRPAGVEVLLPATSQPNFTLGTANPIAACEQPAEGASYSEIDGGVDGHAVERHVTQRRGTGRNPVGGLGLIQTHVGRVELGDGHSPLRKLKCSSFMIKALELVAAERGVSGLSTCIYRCSRYQARPVEFIFTNTPESGLARAREASSTFLGIRPAPQKRRWSDRGKARCSHIFTNALRAKAALTGGGVAPALPTPCRSHRVGGCRENLRRTCPCREVMSPESHPCPERRPIMTAKEGRRRISRRPTLCGRCR